MVEIILIMYYRHNLPGAFRQAGIQELVGVKKSRVADAARKLSCIWVQLHEWESIEADVCVMNGDPDNQMQFGDISLGSYVILVSMTSNNHETNPVMDPVTDMTYKPHLVHEEFRYWCLSKPYRSLFEICEKCHDGHEGLFRVMSTSYSSFQFCSNCSPPKVWVDFSNDKQFKNGLLKSFCQVGPFPHSLSFRLIAIRAHCMYERHFQLQHTPFQPPPSEQSALNICLPYGKRCLLT